MATSRSWTLRNRPVKDIEADTLTFDTLQTPKLEEGQFLLRNILLSLDASNRIWMSDWDSYLPPVALGAPMRGIVVGEVVESRHPDFPVGSLASGLGTWSDFQVSNGAGLTPMERTPGVKLADAFGLMAVAGPTSYIGLHEIGRVKPGDTLVVTAAAGAVGMVVGQLARIHGCRTIGIAGGAAKCKALVEDYGYDHAIDYKNDDVAARLKELAPDGIDVHFENVGGELLDTALCNMKIGGVVVMCGLISSYNATEPVPGPYMFRNVIFRRLRVEGFLCLDFTDRYPVYQRKLAEWMSQGRLKFQLHEVSGLENAVDSVKLIYTGGNQGKLLVRVGADPA